jgi:predicted house-cleaning noncanonical NTP pyrophosphatase (MazG superfamily)
MRTFAYKKLVRDDILSQMLSLGAHPRHRTLGDQEYLRELGKKIVEEGSEITPGDPDKLLEELADLQEVIDCMLAALGKSADQLKVAQAKKNSKFGSFTKRVYLDTAELPDTYPWIAHLESNPDRYPEIKDH